MGFPSLTMRLKFRFRTIHFFHGVCIIQALQDPYRCLLNCHPHSSNTGLGAQASLRQSYGLKAFSTADDCYLTQEFPSMNNNARFIVHSDLHKVYTWQIGHHTPCVARRVPPTYDQVVDR